jgi:hypothetical protein
MLRVACLISTFLIGVGGTRVVNSVWVRFEAVASGAIRVPPNGRGLLRSYITSDGVNLLFERVDFQSVEEARLQLEKFVEQSSQVMTREFIRDREGKFVAGERVVAFFPADDGLVPAVVCQDGRRVYVMSSTSLHHLLIFERSVSVLPR